MTAPRLPHSLSAAAVLLLALSVPLLSGCDDESLTAPEIQNDLFNSYVALGNSITAGFQSGGINSQTQSASFAVRLAEQMQTPFGVPELVTPGCPPPLVQFFNESGIPAPQRPPQTDETTCALRDAQLPPRVNNVAVPGAKVIDVTSNNTSSATPLTQFVLGGQTQAQAALAATPTFATVWIGNNDVLGPALNGTANATPPSEFAEQYTGMLNQLASGGSLEGGVLIGVSNIAFIPFFSPGPVYAGLAQQGELPPNFEVAPGCAAQDPSTGLTPLVPIDYGFGLIGQALQNPGQTVTLDCQAAGTPALTLNEVATLAGTVQQYNAVIQEQAQQRGLAFFNPNDLFAALYTNDDGDPDPTNDLIPKFPDRDSSEPFGRFFSLDGIHPSADAHRVVTNQVIATINREYGTSLQPIEAPALPSRP
jgi:lysophospholipase L1-like esterase